MQYLDYLTDLNIIFKYTDNRFFFLNILTDIMIIDDNQTKDIEFRFI